MELLLSLCAALSLCTDAPKEPELYDYTQASRLFIYTHYQRDSEDYDLSWGSTKFCFDPFQVDRLSPSDRNYKPPLLREETAMRNEHIVAHVYSENKTTFLHSIEPMIYETQIATSDRYYFRLIFPIPFDGVPIHLKIVLTKGDGRQQIMYEEDYNGMTTADYFSERENCYRKARGMHSGGRNRVYY